MVKCQICEKEFKTLFCISRHIRFHKMTSKEYYDKYLKKENEEICLVCNNKTKFIGISAGYLKYCSNVCAWKNDSYRKKFSETAKKNREKRSKISKELWKNKKYRAKVIQSTNNPEYRKKLSDSMKLKWQDPDFRNKVLIILRSDKVRDSISTTLKLKYQNDYEYRQSHLRTHRTKSYRNKLRIAQKNRWKDPKFRQKEKDARDYNFRKRISQTMKSKWKDENFRNDQLQKKQDPIYKKKISLSSTNNWKNEDFRKQQLRLRRDPVYRKKLRITNIKKYLPELEKFLQKNNLTLLDSEYINAHCKHNWKCTKCGFEFRTLRNYIQQKRSRCPKCYPQNHNQSKGEIELGDWIKSFGLNVIQKNRTIIGKEIDMYMPNLKIGIEYDGTYWHSKNAQDVYYPNSKINPKIKQLIKTELCTEKDIQLIHIFNEEWELHQENVKELLKRILFKGYDLLDNECDMITLNRRFSKNPKYYQELGYEVTIIGPKLYPNKGGFTIWDVGYFELRKKKTLIG